jgi:hypothetical protein
MEKLQHTLAACSARRVELKNTIKKYATKNVDAAKEMEKKKNNLVASSCLK